MHFISFILLMGGGQPIVLVLIYLEIWSFVIEIIYGVLIGVPPPLR